jgi:excisionase family DNA binding protein
MDTLLTVTELAALLKVNPETIRRLTRAGKIPAVRLGHAYRYRAADVIAAGALK